MSKYKIIALCGKSGCGKSSLLDYLERIAPDQFNKIIGTTTRPKRQGEINGKDYWFINELDFKALVVSKEIIGYACFNGWYYGTALSNLLTEKPNVGVFNPEAIRQLSKNPELDLSIIWLHTSDKQRLLRQLNREDYPNVNEIIRRFQTDEIDFRNLSNEIKCIHLENEYSNDLNRNVAQILNIVSLGQK